MGVLCLHTFGVALETCMGIWIFSEIFPKREYWGHKHIVSELIVNSMILIVGSRNFFTNMSNKEVYFIVVSLAFLLYRYWVEGQKKLQRKYLSVLNGIIAGIRIIAVIGLIAWNGWVSYISSGMILLGNLYLPFMLYRYFSCGFLQAYLFEMLYLATIGLMKNAYMVYIASFTGMNITEIIASDHLHSYPAVLFGILICVAIYFFVRNFSLCKLMKSALCNYKIWIVMIAVGEIQLLSLLMDFGIDGFSIQDLQTVLLITILVILFLLIVLAKAFSNLIQNERKFLDIRNEAIEQQYQELQEAYQQNRCLIHDEKQMIQYLLECLENDEIQKALEFAKKYNYHISRKSKHTWTGFSTLDFILNMKKRRMDKYAIEFSLNAQIEYLPMEDADFVVMLGNILDNAIEAAQICEIGKREVNLSVRNVNEMFILQLTNTSTQLPKMRKGQFITTKNEADKHGWGLESVRHIVEKYKGNIDFKYDEKMFQVNIFIGTA